MRSSLYSLQPPALRAGVAFLLSATLALGVAGCTSDSKTSASKSAASSTAANVLNDPVVKWADNLCGAISTTPVTLPTLDSSADPSRYKTEVSTFLQSLSATLGKNATSIQQVGAPPITGGADVLSGALSSLTTAKETIDSAKANLDAATVATSAELDAARTALSTALSKANYNGPLTDFKANADLAKAIAAAPQCAQKS